MLTEKFNIFPELIKTFQESYANNLKFSESFTFEKARKMRLKHLQQKVYVSSVMTEKFRMKISELNNDRISQRQ